MIPGRENEAGRPGCGCGRGSSRRTPGGDSGVAAAEMAMGAVAPAAGTTAAGGEPEKLDSGSERGLMACGVSGDDDGCTAPAVAAAASGTGFTLGVLTDVSGELVCTRTPGVGGAADTRTAAAAGVPGVAGVCNAVFGCCCCCCCCCGSLSCGGTLGGEAMRCC